MHHDCGPCSIGALILRRASIKEFTRNTVANRLPVIVLCLAAAGCHFGTNDGGGLLSTHKEPIVLDGTEEEMRALLLERIPLGTPIGKARKVLEKEGFTCHDEESSDGPYIICAQRQAEGSPVAVERRIVIQYADGKVTNIEAKVLGMITQPTETTSAG